MLISCVFICNKKAVQVASVLGQPLLFAAASKKMLTIFRTPNPPLENQPITGMMGIIKKSYYICKKISDNHASTSSLFSAVHQVYQR